MPLSVHLQWNDVFTFFNPFLNFEYDLAWSSIIVSIRSSEDTLDLVKIHDFALL